MALVLATAPPVYFAASLALVFSHTAALLVVLVGSTVVGLVLSRRAGSGAGRLLVWAAVMLPLLAWADTRASASWLAGSTAVAAAIFLAHVVALLDAPETSAPRLPALEVVRLRLNGPGLLAAAFLYQRHRRGVT